MADLGSIFGGLFGISQMFAGADIASSGAALQAQTILTGGQIAAQGAQLTADGFRESAKAVRGAADFNATLDVLQTNRRLASIQRQGRLLISSQRAAAANSGLSIGSKSFLQLQSEALTDIEQTLFNTKLDAENLSRAREFETQIRLTTLENQARAAEYQGAAAKVQAANKAAEAQYAGEISAFKSEQQAFQAIPTLLGGLFGG